MRDGLESQAHQAIGREISKSELGRKLACSAKCLVLHLWVKRERFVGNEKENIDPRTTRPAMLTTSVYWPPLANEWSKNVTLKGSPRSCEVVLAEGSYFLCPKQYVSMRSESQLVEGKKRSLLPVSKSTVYDTGSDDDL